MSLFVSSMVRPSVVRTVLRQRICVNVFRRYSSAVSADYARDAVTPRTRTEWRRLKRCRCVVDERVIALSGAKSVAASFLSNLAANKIPPAGSAPSPLTYSAFLNAGGRVITDAFVTARDAETYWLIVPAAALQTTLQHIAAYNLRGKIRAETLNVRSSAVFAADTDADALIRELTPLIRSGDAFVDPRSNKLGLRIIEESASLLPAELTAVTAEVYDALLALNGIAQFGRGLTTGKSLPLECNLDALNGVSYSKGCYLGQELTARTHWRGVIRKRVMAVSISETAEDTPRERDGDGIFTFSYVTQLSTALPPNSNIIATVDGAEVDAGVFHGAVANLNIGTALIRESLADAPLALQHNKLTVEVHKSRAYEVREDGAQDEAENAEGAVKQTI